MASLTCLACNVGFEDIALGRLHYKTDWHRYNLKRKVANLAPVTLEKFQERQQTQEKQEQEISKVHETCFCKPCNKAFSTPNACENHLQSKKHKEVVAGAVKQNNKKKLKTCKNSVGHDVSSPTEDVDVSPHTEDVDVSPHSEVVNVSPHTEAVDGSGKRKLKKNKTDPMIVDDDESDAESWDSCDENTLGLEECLFCSYVSASLEENVTHMTKFHGFFIPDAEFISDLEGLVTYLGEKVSAGHLCLWCNEKGKKFYSTKDVQRHMIDKGHCKMLHDGDVIYEYADFYDYTSSYPDAENPEVNPDEAVDLNELESDGYSLTLPSGATIGHRSLMRYYKQNLVPHTNEPTKKILPKMLAHYKALGWTGSTGSQVALRVKDLQYMKRMRTQWHMQLGCKANKLRLRFRNPNPL
ncbi:cytoplasmic 60S subunit biogenesis factor ZNF622-like [Physella acuta]|uniref:cytoplasmic 60S subunit biogenesis factor ZNF622-like n=1 Tax=Physella acuta TaxID=109671 RepID=UPI0027DD4AF9|nr:cytoplasmic 60S subunit biogenesis factor ZNF622-like [Physella acuta]